MILVSFGVDRPGAEEEGDLHEGVVGEVEDTAGHRVFAQKTDA